MNRDSSSEERRRAANVLVGLKSIALDKFRQFFHGFGGVIYDHPFWVSPANACAHILLRPQFIVSSTVIAIVAGISFLSIQFETSAENLYALPASQARADLAKQTSLFGVPPRISMVFVVNQQNNSTNVLTKAVLTKLANLDHFLHHQMASDTGFTFEDVCYRQEMQYNTTQSAATALVPLGQSAQCMKMTPLDLYRNERLFGSPVVTRNWPYVPNLTSNKIVKADLALTDTSVQHLPSGTSKIFGATGFLLLYHASGEADKLEKTLQWEQAMIDFINHDIKPFSAIDSSQPGPPPAAITVGPNNARRLRDDEFMFPAFTDHDWSDFRVFVNAERSWEDELARSTKFDARLIRDYVIAYVIIAIYMIVFNRTSNPIRSKSVCGFLGSVSALFGYAAGGGICYWLGMKHCPTMHASPFLVLAIGLDNTFVVLNFYTLSYGQIDKPRERCRNALTDSGIALFITTFTSVLSFAVGALGPYTAVRNFCIQTGMGLCGGFVYNIVFFYPCLCLEARAESANRVFFLPDSWTQKWLLHAGADECPPLAVDPTSQHLRSEHISEESTRITSVSVQTPGVTDDPFRAHRRTATVPAPPGSSSVEDTPTHPSPLPRKSMSDLAESSLVFSPPELRALPSDPSMPTATAYTINVDHAEEPRAEPSTLTRIIQNMDMFQIASLQWQFASRLKAVAREVEKRGIDIDGEVLDDARSALPTNVPSTAHEWVTMSPSEMLNCDLKTSHKAASMGLQLLEEPAGNKGKRTRQMLMRWFGPALTHGLVQKLMITGMLAYLLFFIFSAVSHLTAGLELENLSPPDSYLREAFAVSHDKFPIFPKQTFVMFTSPNVAEEGVNFNAGTDQSPQTILDNFVSTDYGVREPEITASGLAGWLRSEKSEPISDYVNALGEIPWWSKSTFFALAQLDAHLRSMPQIQDILNGMLLFYEENGDKIFNHANTDAVSRRKTFYKALNHWLRHGVVGQHVRDQFKFDALGKLPLVDLGDGNSIPQLIGFRMMIFNYNFLNSYSQSHYMLDVRRLVKNFSQSVWSGHAPTGIRSHGEWTLEGAGESVEPVIKSGSLDGQKMLDAPYPNYNALIARTFPTESVPADLSSSGAGKGDVITPPQAAGFVAQAFMDTFLFFETDATIWQSTLLNMLTAFISILIASSILMEGWSSVALVTIMICSVDIGVFGGMALLGLQLNILTMILLVLSIGFSVDYTVHVIHTFCHTVGKQTNARAVETMILICSPMTHGALSTLLGILPIYFRKEYVLQNFFWMMALVILFGFLNGVIFLPIIMSRSRQLLMKRADRQLARDGEDTEHSKQLDELTFQLISAITNKLDTETVLKQRHLSTSPHTTAETLES